MAENDKDDLADALARLAAGEHHEEEDPNASHHGHDSIEPTVAGSHAPTPETPGPPKLPPHSPSVPRATPPSPTTPAPRRGAAPAKPVAARPTTPASPATAHPAASGPTRPTAPAPSANPARPTSSAPARSANPPASASDAPLPPVRHRPALPNTRPTVPNLTPPESLPPVEPSSAPESGEMQEIYDNDEVIAPAPDASVFAPKPKIAPPPRKIRPPFFQTRQFRQTAIPVMLTSGGIMLIAALLPLLMGSDSIFADFPLWLPIALALFGLLLLGLAALNMLQVKKDLEQQPK